MRRCGRWPSRRRRKGRAGRMRPGWWDGSASRCAVRCCNAEGLAGLNAEGLAGLHDRPRPGRPEQLTARPAGRAAGLGAGRAGPGGGRDQQLPPARHRRPHPGALGGVLHVVRPVTLSALSRMLRRMGLSWQTTRPVHPEADAEAQELYEEPRRHARSGQGRPPRTGIAAVVRGGGPGRPEGPQRPSLVHPRRAPAGTPGPAVPVDLHLRRRPAQMPAAFRWPGRAAPQVPGAVTLLPLPPYSPELNPVERVRLHLRERYPSFRLRSACIGASRPSWTRPAPLGTRYVTRPGAPPP